MHKSRGCFLLMLVFTLMSCDGGSTSSSHTNDDDQPAASLDAEVDRQMQIIMRQSGASAATIAIAKKGQLRYEKAYGFQDAEQKISLATNTLMRTASVVKPVTAATIRQLDSVGLLSLNDHVFCNGNNNPCWLTSELLSETTDDRAGDITIQHLISHTGGWYSDVSGDPLEQEVEIREAIGLSTAPSRTDVVRFVMQRPLDFSPGEPDYLHSNYSNFGYLLLGMIVEQATYMDYEQYVQLEIMADLGIDQDDFKKGASRLVDHDVREPIYISTDVCPSVFERGQFALCSEEGANNANWFSALGMISTAEAMAMFAQRYRMPPNYASGYGVIGEPIIQPSAYGSHGGSLPGLSSMVRQLPSGVSYAVFLNISFNMEPWLANLDQASNLAD